MTPKERAKELVDKFYRIIPLDKMTIDFNIAKKCALMAVEEIIEANPIKFDEDDNCIASYWWVEVKQEIEKL